MVALFNCLNAFFLDQGLDKTYYIGYSGGLDSHVLLHVCAELRKHNPLRLKAIHVHHGLSVNAHDWAVHCATICADLQIELIQRSIDARSSDGDSPEAIARERRYAVFADILTSNDVLLTAHQQDDQAETVLLQSLRGAGPKGLSAMPVFKSFAKGFHARPFLSVSRAELQNYAEAFHLKWIDDESNENKNYTRNFLRHDLLPLLKQRWPTVIKTLARVADNCAEAQAYITENAMRDLEVCRDEQETLSIKKLRLLNAVQQRQVLRVWFEEKKIPLPSSIKLHQIQHDFLEARQDKSPHMSWSGTELRRYDDQLYAMTCLPHHDVKQIISWDLSQPLFIPLVGEWRAVSTENKGLRFDIQQVVVRFRQGGERCYFSEQRCHRLLKHLLQEWRVPPWERDRVPLLYVGEVLVAVGNFFLDGRYISAPGLKLKLTPHGL